MRSHLVILSVLLLLVVGCGKSVQAQETEKESVAALKKRGRGIIRDHEDGTVRLFHLETSLTITAADLSHLTALTNLTVVTVTGPSP